MKVMFVSMRGLLSILATYFVLSLVALAASIVDLPPSFYALYVLLLPLVSLGHPLEPVLTVLGLWSQAGPGGWINYTGPSFGGLLLIAIVGWTVSALLVRQAYRSSK